MTTLNDIQLAREKIKEVAHYTPLQFSNTFSELANNEIFLKLENFQKTGSFKVRGAYNKIALLPESDQNKGVITASAGNHAQGVAFGSSRAGISSTIVMPNGASLTKIEATKKYGANVILYGDSFDDAVEYAFNIQKETGATFVHAFNDSKVIAGQGTIALEILEQCSNIDAIVCPIGGGGLISGVALAAKSINPSIKVYGVQAEACPSMASSLAKNKCVKVSSHSTIADGIAVKQPGELTFNIVQTYVDDIFVVNDIQIAQTIFYLMERSKLLVEGSGAAALTALLNHKIPMVGKKIAVILSGGNIDINFVSRIVERGLVEEGRFLTILTKVPDKPGFLNGLLNIIAHKKANVISINHSRISSRILPGQTEIELSLETRNNEHIDEIETALKENGYEFSRKM